MATVRLCAISDLHGHLPEIADCDVLLLGGDYHQSMGASSRLKDHYDWYENSFRPWLRKISRRKIEIVGVAGNHDFLFQERPDELRRLNLPWTYLQDSSCEVKGLKIYGSPHQPTMGDWAFNADEEELEQIWQQIPHNLDVLLLHGAPYGYGDEVAKFEKGKFKGKENVGSPSLTERIKEVKPKVVVCGHIHVGFGRYQLDQTTILNVAHVDRHYQPKNPPTYFTLETNNV